MTRPVIDHEPVVQGPSNQAQERLLILLAGLHKTARLVDITNATFTRQAETFLTALRHLAPDSGEVTIKTISGRYFINESLVTIREKQNSGLEGLEQEWHSLHIGGLRFDLRLTADELARFFSLVSREGAGDDPGHALELLIEELKQNRLENIKVLARQTAQAEHARVNEELRRQFRESARRNFFRSMETVQEIVACSRDQKEINISRTKRVVHSLIDHIVRDESSLLELASIKNYDDYTFAHSTNVCVYSLTLGVRLNFDRPRLSQLGFAALFHDIGKVKLPADLIRKPDAYDEDDWLQMQRHPSLGAKTILRNMPFDAHTARAARGAMEHHINEDFTGYPMLRLEQRPTNLFSKIISIADTFDALTSGRVYLKRKIEPDEVLKKMRFQMTIKFDPFLLKIFNEIIGIYPAGSLVLLSTDEIALVLTNNEQDKARPYVKIVADRGGLLDEAEWVDLFQEDQQHRSIVRQIDPAAHGLNIEDFVLRD